MQPEWFAWYNMHQRCYNEQVKNYKNYGGRGIKVCESWNLFENFIRDLGKRPSNTHSLDRINNDGHYEPNNCRRATPQQQTENRRQEYRKNIRPNNITGIAGVGFSRTQGRWCAYARIKYKQVRLYWGIDFFEACCARKSWEIVNAR